MHLNPKFVLILFLLSGGYRFTEYMLDFSLPGWIGNAAILILVLSILWFLLKLPGWRRQDQKSREALLQRELSPDPVVQNNIKNSKEGE